MSFHSGSLCASEKLSQQLHEFEYKTTLSSRKKNKILRLSEIILTLLTSKKNVIHIDVYSWQAFFITEISSLICNVLKKTYILTLHGGALPDFYNGASRRINRVLKKAKHITTPSMMLKSFFEDKGFKIQYIPNSIDLTNFKYDRLSVQPFSMLWVRAFDKIYNPKVAVEILEQVHAKYPQTTLTMIGPDKGLLSSITKLINEKKLEKHIQILGPVPNNTLYKYYQTHAVFLNTTSYESFGVAVMEAAACGIPIVSSKVGEIPYLWSHNHNILLVDALNSDSFAKSVITLFDTPTIAHEISINARRKAEDFEWNKIKHNWLKLLTDLS